MTDHTPTYAERRSLWVDAAWLALKSHTRWEDDGTPQSAEASEWLRAWANRQATMGLDDLVRIFDAEHRAPASEKRQRRPGLFGRLREWWKGRK